MKKFILPALMPLFLILMFACKSYTDPALYSYFEPRVISDEARQVYVLRVQGKGVTRGDAVKNAGLQAVRDVVFKDIHVTYGDHKSLLRLINNPSVENDPFFTDFFAAKGPYLQYVAPLGKDREFYESGSNCVVIMNVRVDRAALKECLTEANLIK